MTESVVPRWLKLQGEIDYLYFLLGQHQQHMPKPAIDSMIDDTTGFARERKKSIPEIVTRMKKLKREWSKETGQEADTKMEDELFAHPDLQ